MREPCLRAENLHECVNFAQARLRRGRTYGRATSNEAKLRYFKRVKILYQDHRWMQKVGRTSAFGHREERPFRSEKPHKNG